MRYRTDNVGKEEFKKRFISVDLEKHIEAIKAKFLAENVDINDQQACEKVLSKCVMPEHLINIYRTHLIK